MTHRRTCALALLLACSAPAAANTQPQPKVDLVIALDTSGSMRGLIDATRLQLWNAVRLLTRAQPQPVVRVGLITFGNKWSDPAAGWVKRELELTTDLDAVSSRLFSLTARGANEYVARTVQTATRQMAWDQSPTTLKILFVAGNESAEQDPRVGLGQALAEARQRGILVNAIYCGRPEAGDARGWRVVASVGGGKFAAIDHTRAIAARVTPYDAQLAALSRELSRTYVAFGKDGDGLLARQREEDERAAKDGVSAAAERAATKATSAYRNEHWDVVDAVAKKEKVADLPRGLREMSEDERARFIRGHADRRRQVQAQIAALAARRDAWLARGTGAPADVANPYGSGPGGLAAARGRGLLESAGTGSIGYATTSGGGVFTVGGSGGARATAASGAGYAITSGGVRGNAEGSVRAAATGTDARGLATATPAADITPVRGTMTPVTGAAGVRLTTTPATAAVTRGSPFPAPSSFDAPPGVGEARGGSVRAGGDVAEPAAPARMASRPASNARYFFEAGTVMGGSPPVASAAPAAPPPAPTPAEPAMARRARPAAKPAAPAPRQTTMEDAFSGTLRRQAAENGYSF